MIYYTNVNNIILGNGIKNRFNNNDVAATTITNLDTINKHVNNATNPRSSATASMSS